MQPAETIAERVRRTLNAVQEVAANPQAHIPTLGEIDAQVASIENGPFTAAGKKRLIEEIRQQEKPLIEGYWRSFAVELRAQARELGLLIDLRPLKRQRRSKPKVRKEPPAHLGPVVDPEDQDERPPFGLGGRAVS